MRHSISASLFPWTMTVQFSYFFSADSSAREVYKFPSKTDETGKALESESDEESYHRKPVDEEEKEETSEEEEPNVIKEEDFKMVMIAKDGRLTWLYCTIFS